MTTMNYEDLIDLGFNKNEAKVYLALIKFGKSDASQLIKYTKFHKNIVYDNLDKLIDKGLVTYMVECSKRMFSLASSEMLVQLFKEKKVIIEKKEKKASIIAKEIDKISYQMKSKQEATIYRGIKGIKSFYKDLLDIGKDYIVFGAPQESLDIMGEHFWLNFETKGASKNIKARLLFNESIKSYGQKLPKKSFDIRYFDKDFEPLTETNIQEDRVAVIVWTEEPLLFLIQDEHVADSYKTYFEDMWKKAKQ
jgi:sugar-specific transcriptional regulator TrmB